MIQVIGTLSCKETQKLQRWLKDRSIAFHFLDLGVKPLAKGEIVNVTAGLENAPHTTESLINVQSKIYKEKGLAHFDSEPLDLLLQNPGILKTPLIRSGKNALVGYDAKRLETWKKDGKFNS